MFSCNINLSNFDSLSLYFLFCFFLPVVSFCVFSKPHIMCGTRRTCEEKEKTIIRRMVKNCQQVQSMPNKSHGAQRMLDKPWAHRTHTQDAPMLNDYDQSSLIYLNAEKLFKNSRKFIKHLVKPGKLLSVLHLAF